MVKLRVCRHNRMILLRKEVTRSIQSPRRSMAAYDCLFVVLDPGDIYTLTHAAPERLKVAHSKERTLERSAKDLGHVIVVRPTWGPGRQEAQDLADRLRPHAQKVGLWTVPELGRETCPDLKTFDELWGPGGKDGLSTLLINERPWDNAAVWSLRTSSNGNGKHVGPLVGSDDEDDAEPVGDVVGDVDRAAFHGPLGQLARLTQPETEANELFVLVTLLVFFGIAVGRTAYFIRSARHHYMNLFVALIGLSGVSRKGTSADVVMEIFRRVDPKFAEECIRGGLNSGPGLLYSLRDPSKRRVKKKGKMVEVEDDGVENKLRVCMETEFGSLLKQGHREQNPLFENLRMFFDGDGVVRSDTKTDPLKVTGGHVGIVAHGTPSDMNVHVDSKDKEDGTLNRFLVIYGTRSKVLPRGGDVFLLLDQVLGNQLNQLREALDFARDVKRIDFSKSVEDRWDRIYREFASPPPGQIGQLFVRAPIIILRLASIFALADLVKSSRSVEVQECHLDAAMAIWKQSDRSLRWLFPDDVDKKAEKLLAGLAAASEPLTKSQIRRNIFNGHGDARGLGKLLTSLCVSRRIEEIEGPPTAGRPASRFRLKEWT